MRLPLVPAARAVLAIPVPPATAGEPLVLERIDAGTVELKRDTATPAAIWVSADTALDAADRKIAARSAARSLRIELPAGERAYVIVEEAGGPRRVVAERRLPLEQGSNFRDIGGYETRDGRVVRWGRVYRSGAMPLLTDADYRLIGSLGLDSVVDLRSLEERSIAPNMVDDRTGALFLANDYSLKPLFERLSEGQGENMYRGMDELLAPQYRALVRRILAGEGAVLYHCSAGQDRTGIATALLYDALGVDRETILKDYHLSTRWRQPEWEMPEIDPANYPGNPIVQYYTSLGKGERHKPEPLFAPSGESHLAQFFTYVDQRYGGAEAYIKNPPGFFASANQKMRETMLD